MTWPNPNCNPTTLKTVYLGQPGAMVNLSMPDAGYTAPLGRAGVNHQLAEGGVAVTRRRKTRRLYGISFSGLTPELADPILAFYTGLMGLGPFRLVDPAWRNAMSLDVSTFGQQVGAIVGWDTPSADAQPTFNAAITPFQEASGVLQWATPVNGHYLSEWQNPAGTAVPDASNSVPYLADQPYVISLYARTASSTCSVVPAAFGAAANGSGLVTVSGAAVTLTTAWQRLTVPVPVGSSGWSAAATPYIGAALKCNQTSAPTVYVSDAQIEVGPPAANPWVAGLGCPKVIVEDPFGVTVNVRWLKDTTLVLAEM